ncbi:uncharacterized protein [Apostichopus japonicus]|uniref:uncharacterized protein isoform X4 n=1 Tax=Stichopus japonicus TaxID=307972 RepID=UPI003AB835F3
MHVPRTSTHALSSTQGSQIDTISNTVDLKNQWLSFLDYTSTTTVESVCPHLRSSYNPVASAVSVVYLCLHTQDLLLSGTIYTCGIITTVKKCLSVWIRKQGGLSGQCTRENCRYLHPPPHLKTQLEIKGQNNIAARRMLQNAHLQNQILAQGNPIPIQPTLLSTVPTSLPSGVGTVPSVRYSTSPVAAATSQANAETNAAAYYHGHQYLIPVAVSMAPSATHSTFSPHMYPGSYFSQAMQTALPTVATSTSLPGSAHSTAHPGFSEIPMQTPIIPNALGAPSFQLLQPKAKNDRLEYLKSPNPMAGVSPYQAINSTPAKKVCREFQRGNCSRGEIECKFAHPDEHLTVDSTDNTVTVCMDFVKGRCTREKCKYFHPPAHLQAKIKTSQLQQQPSPPNIAAVMWNCLKDDTSRWPSSPEYSSYAQNHQSLACYPRPPKLQAGMVTQPQMVQSTMFPSNLVYNQLPQMTMMAQPQFLQSPLPMMPTFPLMAPHFIHNQNTSETLPVCRDFKSGNCKRPNCKYAHVVEDKVEIVEGKVTLCRDAAKGKCMRTNCKYYHVPITATNGILPATASANATAASATF